MILIYAYINKFKNYTTQEIIFDPRWQINFSNKKLSIQYRGQSSASAVIRGDRKLDNLHILVGKTGSGKTNLLQMIGAKHDVRYHRKWEGEDDSYFLLYSISDTEFFLEICDMEIMQFPKPVERDDSTIPEPIRENARRAGTLRTVRFALEKALNPGETAVRFCAVKEYGYEKGLPELKVRDMAMIMNCYDVHAFIRPPYPDDKEDFTDFRSDWIGRAAFPYQRTSLWQICGYIREYLTSLEPGSGKRQVSFLLSTHNFADQYPLKLSRAVEKEYWTFYDRLQDEKRAIYDAEARERVRKRKKKKTLTNKQMFIHDLWTDYAKYLRKWVEKIRNFNAEEEPAEDLDAYQEFMDYYIGKTRRESIDPTVLPDGEKMSIVRRCTWLAENSMCWASGEICSSSRLTGGRKPISAISSASSMTTTSTDESVSACWRSRSSRRPGQATTISAPAFRSRIWWMYLTPPYTVVVFMPNVWASGISTSLIWFASSRVGASTRPRGCGRKSSARRSSRLAFLRRLISLRNSSIAISPNES